MPLNLLGFDYFKCRGTTNSHQSQSKKNAFKALMKWSVSFESNQIYNLNFVKPDWLFSPRLLKNKSVFSGFQMALYFEVKGYALKIHFINRATLLSCPNSTPSVFITVYKSVPLIDPY